MSLASALRTRDLGELPRKRDAAWHYTDLRAAIPAVPPPSPEAEPFGLSPFTGLPGTSVTFVNGRRLGATGVSDPDSADSADSARDPDSADSANTPDPFGEPHSTDSSDSGLRVRPRGEADSADSTDSGLRVRLRGEADSADSPDSVFVGAVESDVHSVHLVHCRFLSDATHTGHGARLALTVAAGAHAVLLESHEGRGSAYVSDVRLDIALGEGARLERIVIADEPADAVSVATCHIAVEGEAHFAQTVLASGARLQRIETDVRHPGAGARVRLDGVYLLGGRRHADLTSVVDHEGPGGATAQLTKGVVAGQGRGVFQGRITVRAGADGTDARMGHHALLLSDRAEVDAKPELEIWADDVQCAHGNTVGALDAEALFYAMSRGLPEADARAMLTEAFVGEVVARIEHAGARDAVEGWVATRLRGLG